MKQNGWQVTSVTEERGRRARTEDITWIDYGDLVNHIGGSFLLRHDRDHVSSGNILQPSKKPSRCPAIPILPSLVSPASLMATHLYVLNLEKSVLMAAAEIHQ
jgi:hypothetical protein